MSGSWGSCLRRRGGTWWFRRRVPAALTGDIKRTEITRSRSCPTAWCRSGVPEQRWLLSVCQDWHADDGIIAERSDGFQRHVTGSLDVNRRRKRTPDWSAPLEVDSLSDCN